MADNFDTNVARRKPNVSRKKRPVHPWDIPSANESPPLEPSGDVDAEILPDESLLSIEDSGGSATSQENNTDTGADKSVPVSVSVEEKVAAEPPDKPRIADDLRTSRSRSTTRHDAPSKRSSDLSDSINIHSNYCKLDNDISDYLFATLSASAQSVYLRLYRQSFGWNRNWASESLPKLSKSCNMSLQTVRKAIKELQSFGCIRVEDKNYHKATVYRVFLPSELNIGKHGMPISDSVVSGSLISDSPNGASPTVSLQNSDSPSNGAQDISRDDISRGGVHNLEGVRAHSGGQDSFIQSVYFSGTSIYALLESEGPLPKNILTYITDTHLACAVPAIDEFYDSIGFSVVSRSLYRRSVIDYIDLLKSGFSHDDIKYAVRWMFKNSRSRPESFTLVKHTIHLAMNDFIKDLKAVSGEVDIVREKNDAIQKSMLSEPETPRQVTSNDLRIWLGVVDDLREKLNEYSFKTFIEPLSLLSAAEEDVTVGAPADSVSWIVDHYLDMITESYEATSGRRVRVEIKQG